MQYVLTPDNATSCQQYCQNQGLWVPVRTRDGRETGREAEERLAAARARARAGCGIRRVHIAASSTHFSPHSRPHPCRTFAAPSPRRPILVLPRGMRSVVQDAAVQMHVRLGRGALLITDAP